MAAGAALGLANSTFLGVSLCFIGFHRGLSAIPRGTEGGCSCHRRSLGTGWHVDRGCRTKRQRCGLAGPLESAGGVCSFGLFSCTRSSGCNDKVEDRISGGLQNGQDKCCLQRATANTKLEAAYGPALRLAPGMLRLFQANVRAARQLPVQRLVIHRSVRYR